MDPYQRWLWWLRSFLGAPPRSGSDFPPPQRRADLPPPARSRVADAWPDADCHDEGGLRGVVHLGDLDASQLARYLPRRVRIDNGYSLYTIALWSAGSETRATVAVPLRVEPPAGGWHLVANNHGTTGLGRHCGLVDTDAGAGLAALFGARGMIGVAPEYPGLASPGVHPYLVAESESQAALDALRAARTFARWKGWPLSGRCAMVGLSQGGHATLAAAARHRAMAPDLDLAAFAVAAPTTVWEEHWRAGLHRDGPHLVYHALLVYAWAHYYKYRGPALWSPTVARTIDDDMGGACAWSPEGGPTLDQRLPRRAAELFSPGLLAAFRSGFWGPYRLFQEGFASNRIGPYAQAAPLRIYQGSADDAVPERATRQLVAALRRGGVAVDYEVVPGGGHIDTAFGVLGAPDLRSLDALAWLRQQLDRR